MSVMALSRGTEASPGVLEGALRERTMCPVGLLPRLVRGHAIELDEKHLKRALLHPCCRRELLCTQN